MSIAKTSLPLETGTGSVYVTDRVWILVPSFRIIICKQRFLFSFIRAFRKEWHINTLPPGGSVYTAFLVNVQFSGKWVHIDLCYKDTWTNKPTHAPSSVRLTELNGHWDRPNRVTETINAILHFHQSLQKQMNKKPHPQAHRFSHLRSSAFNRNVFERVAKLREISQSLVLALLHDWRVQIGFSPSSWRWGYSQEAWCPALPLTIFPCCPMSHRILGWARALSFPYHVSAASSTTVTQTVKAPAPCHFYLFYYEAKGAALQDLQWWRQDRHPQKDADQLLAGCTERGSSGIQKLVIPHGAGDSCLRTSKGHRKPICGPKQKGNPDHFLSVNAARAGAKGEGG